MRPLEKPGRFRPANALLVESPRLPDCHSADRTKVLATVIQAPPSQPSPGHTAIRSQLLFSQPGPGKFSANPEHSFRRKRTGSVSWPGRAAQDTAMPFRDASRRIDESYGRP